MSFQIIMVDFLIREFLQNVIRDRFRLVNRFGICRIEEISRPVRNKQFSAYRDYIGIMNDILIL